MGNLITRLAFSLLVAVAIGVTIGGLGPSSVEAKKSKPFDYDVSRSQFARDCRLAGGTFYDMGGGRVICQFDGWEMECDANTGSCVVYCDPDVPCVSRQRPGGVRPGLNAIVNLDATTMAPVHR